MLDVDHSSRERRKWSGVWLCCLTALGLLFHYLWSLLSSLLLVSQDLSGSFSIYDIDIMRQCSRSTYVLHRRSLTFDIRTLAALSFRYLRCFLTYMFLVL